jgi:hypothetical protein
MTDATTLIELGSGTSDKTRLLLDALAPRRFVPFDVSEETLRTSAQRLAREYPTLEVLAVVGAWGSFTRSRCKSPESDDVPEFLKPYGLIHGAPTRSSRTPTPHTLALARR